eukprot:scaffold122177_cov34-Phaeocystis_antarctica.AAC.1
MEVHASAYAHRRDHSRHSPGPLLSLRAQAGGGTPYRGYLYLLWPHLQAGRLLHPQLPRVGPAPCPAGRGELHA